MKHPVYRILLRMNREVERIRLALLNGYYRNLLDLRKEQLRVSGPCNFDINGKLALGRGIYIRSKKHNQVEISVRAGGLLTIQDNVFINQGVRISASREICIMQNVLIGDEVILLDNDFHSAQGEIEPGKILIEDGVWIGSRAIILKNVVIGHGAVIGAGAVVSKSVPARSLVVGIPARVVKEYT